MDCFKPMLPFVFLLLLSSGGDAIKCYNGAGSNYQSLTCPNIQGQNVFDRCVKVYHSSTGTVRSCFNIELEQQLSNAGYSVGNGCYDFPGDAKMCICSSNLCNNANANGKMSHVAMAAATAIAFVMKKILQ